METIPLLVSFVAFGYSAWTYFHANRQSRVHISKMREIEDNIRAHFTKSELAYFDRHFKEQGIARKRY